MKQLDSLENMKNSGYADDLTMVDPTPITSRSAEAQGQKLQEALDKLGEICVKLGLKLNKIKTEAMCFGVSLKKLPRLKLGDSEIAWVKTYETIKW